MARTLAKQFASVFEDECAPFQYALSHVREPTVLGHMFRAATDANHRATILSVDGIGASDHVFRASMLGRLATMPGGVPGMLPFVRLSYASPPHILGGDEGQRWTIVQAEGGEQGDPLMPLLFAIGVQAALEEVRTTLALSWTTCMRFATLNG